MNKVQIDLYLWDQVWERLDEGLELDAAKLLKLIATNPGDVAAWYQDHPLTAVATIEALLKLTMVTALPAPLETATFLEAWESRLWEKRTLFCYFLDMREEVKKIAHQTGSKDYTLYTKSGIIVSCLGSDIVEMG